MRTRCTPWLGASFAVALAAFAVALTAFPHALSAQADETPALVPGDSREGYESVDYRTRSRSLEGVGAPLDLVALSAQPPRGLPALPRDVEAPTAARVALGRKLFVDRRLSFNGTLSCAMCHIPEQGFTHNELATPVGIEGRNVKRNAPALYNVVYRTTLFHDGRERNLAHQVWSPLLAENEMGNPSVGIVLDRIAAAHDYRAPFFAAFGEGATLENVGRALAAYERTLLSGDSAFDRWRFGGNADALTPEAKEGFTLFERHGCSSCHVIAADHALFTDDGFHDTGIGYYSASRGRDASRMQVAPGIVIDIRSAEAAPEANDVGRYEATRLPDDRWKYRTPALRNVALTAPYMHDGSLATLAAVIDYYNGGGTPHAEQDPRIRALAMTVSERRALVVFLEALTGSNVVALAADARSTTIGDVGGAP